MGTIHYKAFISYSHVDETWARWLQRALEGYRVPRRLIGTEGEFGRVPARLSPVFRDREDLSSAADLSSKVQHELEHSESLIVICSPAAAQSRWVNEEIRHFRSLGRHNRVLALIVDGDPLSDDPALQCFPRALTINPDGSACEPLAADVRTWADGKLLAKLKVIAGMLGIRLDELRRRDQQRRRRNWAMAATAFTLVAALTAVLALSALSSRRAADLQRANTEELLNYMLGNLKRLDPIAGLEVLDAADQQMLDYLQSLGFEQLDEQQLLERGMDERNAGIGQRERGDLVGAMEHFRVSRAAFIELHRREGSTHRALFELGQSEFWVGYVLFDQGDLDAAQKSFTRYGVLTRRLVNANPNDAAIVMELSYTLTNLSAVENAREEPDTDKALQLVQSALQYNQIALVLDPDNTVYRRDLVHTLAFLADAWLESCDLGKAYEFRQQSVARARELVAASPDDRDLQHDLAYGLSGLAWIQRQISALDLALQNLEESRELLDRLAQVDRDNPMLRWESLMRLQRMLAIRSWLDPPQSLWSDSVSLRGEMEAVLVAGGPESIEAIVDGAHALIAHSALAWRLGRKGEAESSLGQAIEAMRDIVGENPENRRSRQGLARALFEYWSRHGSLPTGADADVMARYLDDPSRIHSYKDASLAARLEVMRGNIGLARDYTAYLQGRGYFDPEFAAFCRGHGLCD